MTLDGLGIVPVLLVMATSLGLLWQLSWRWTLTALIVQYLAVLWLVAVNWPLGLSLVKLVVGLVAGGVLASSLSVQTSEAKATDHVGLIFRSLVAIFIWVMIYFSTPAIEGWLKIDREVLWGGLVLSGVGLIQLGMTVSPIRVAIGLLTFLAGFEVLYSALESSLLLAGLLAVINLGLALVGVYLATSLEKEVES